MNPHLPFIIGAYGIFTVVLTYCALVPIIRGRKIREQVKRYHKNRSRNDTQT
jgi:heme exporter protein CcmD